MPVFFEDDTFRYEVTRWRKRHRVTTHCTGRTDLASREHVEQLGRVFSAFDIVPHMPVSQKNHMTIWAYRYFCLGVSGPMTAQEYWLVTPAQEIVLLLLSGALDDGAF